MTDTALLCNSPLYANNPHKYRQATLSKSPLSDEYLTPELIKHPRVRDDPIRSDSRTLIKTNTTTVITEWVMARGLHHRLESFEALHK